MPYNIQSLVYGDNRRYAFGSLEARQSAIEATGFAKLCVHGHWMHTPNNAPLPAHNGEYHNPDRNGIGGYYPDVNGSHGQGDLRFDQFHEKDLTGRGYDADEIIRHLLTTNGNLSMCPHGGVVPNGSGSCSPGSHAPQFMRGVERNMSWSENEDALEAGTHHGGEWRNHYTWSQSRNEVVDEEDEEDDASGWGRKPRSEEELEREEPERVAGIRDRIDKVMALNNSPRLQDSDYTAHAFPAGEFYDKHSIDDRSVEQASHDGMYGGTHTVIGYHKGIAVGRLTYDSEGHVGGWYIDHKHQKGPVSIKMLAAAHQHLLDLGNPIGMLKSDMTSSNSAAVIRKIDPNSTYLRQNGANTGWNDDTEWDPKSHDEGTHPLLPEHTERRSREEWRDLSETTGLNIHELHAISPDSTNRQKVDLDRVGDEAADIHQAYKDVVKTRENQALLKLKTETRDAIPSRIAQFSIPAGYLGDTANLETQMPENVSDTIGQPNPHQPSWRRNTFASAGLDTLADANDLTTTVDQTRRQIATTRFRSSEHQRRLTMDADIRRGANPDEELMKRVSADSSGVWTGEEDTPVQKSPEERARALMGIPRHRRGF